MSKATEPAGGVRGSRPGQLRKGLDRRSGCLERILPADTQLRSQQDITCRRLAQPACALILAEHRRLGDMAAVPAVGGQHPGGLQLPIRPADGASSEPQIGGELTDRREPGARGQDADRRHRGDLRSDLLKGRHRRFNVN